MKLLILGGTKFLGRHTVELAKKAGHTITLFHRGETNPELFPEVEHILGNRDGGLDKLAGRTWDAAIDTCGYFPRLVGASARYLADKVGHYTFVSSISVYSKFYAGMDESAPVAVLDDPTVEEITEKTYGGLKALCEEAAEHAMPGRVLSVRAGLIVGPYDQTDRFTYWVRRVSTGGRVLVPSPPERPVQFIHAADLAAWMLRMAEHGEAGIYNATGPIGPAGNGTQAAAPYTMEQVLTACREAAGSKAEFVWVDERYLLERKVELWSDLPLATPAEEDGLMEVDVSRAAAAGLTARPLLNIVRETLAWDATRPIGTELKAGLKPAREAELLTEWDHPFA